MTDETSNSAMARTYALMGLKVFPLYSANAGRCSCPVGDACGSPGKHPLTANGVHAATLDPEAVEAWWRRWPNAGIGLPAHDNGLAVLDIDPRHGGVESMTVLTDDLKHRGITLPHTLTQVTGSGGWHLVFAEPPGGIKGGSNVFGPDYPGLDTRGRGGYIVVAPSEHVSGSRYQWVDLTADISPWPLALTKMMEG